MGRGKRNQALFIAAAALVAVAGPALGAEGRIPLWTQTALFPGLTPGKYIVTRDIAAVPGSGAPAIAVFGGPGFEDIDIDLNGFTITGDPFGGAPTIQVTGLQSFTLRNGNVRMAGPAGNTVDVASTFKVVIEDVKTQGGANGILLSDASSIAVRRNVVSFPSGEGITANGFGGFPPISGVIEDNQVYDPALNGITLAGPISSVEIRTNEVESAGGAGISVTGIAALGGSIIIAENTVQESAAEGIFVRQLRKGKIYNNTVYLSGFDGIAMFATIGFLVLDNVSGGNGGSGLVVDGSQNHIDRNVLTGNGLAGLWFSFGSFDNTYGRNTARANGGFPGPCAFPPIAACPAPWGPGGTFPPDYCNDGPGNTSFCDNHMPGPPQG